MRTKRMNSLNHNGDLTSSKTEPLRWLRLTFWLVLATNLICSLYASVDARGLYSDGAAYLVAVYGSEWFVLFDTRTVVQILRQAPIVFLSRYTSASLFECGQAFTFAMLTLPTFLCALCWAIAPRNQKAWILFPLTSLLVGFAATSMHAIGEAAIATSYYWILLFLLLFRTHSRRWQVLFLLLCIPAFRLHEGTFPLTIVLLLAVAMRSRSVADTRERWFVWSAVSLLVAIFAYQINWVVHPQFPDDRAGILRGLTEFEFLYLDGHFNLPLVTGTVGLLALVAVALMNFVRPVERADAIARMIAIVWALLALSAIAAALTVEQSFSPYAHLQARYHPPLVSSALGITMLLLLRFRSPVRLWMGPATIFILMSLCVTQAVADIAATNRWNAYVVDLQTRLANGRGLIPWETTLQTGNERADINWRLMEIGWVVPFTSIAFAPGGAVNAIINYPVGTTFRPFDPERPDQLLKLRGIDYTSYQRFLATAGIR